MSALVNSTDALFFIFQKILIENKINDYITENPTILFYCGIYYLVEKKEFKKIKEIFICTNLDY